MIWSFSVSDGSVSVNGANSVSIEAVNDAPIATFTDNEPVTEDATSITGSITATDVDSTNLSYQLVGAPIDGLSINATTGDWSFDPTHASYQSLKKDQTLDITVNYSVTDDQGASDQSAFVITLTGSNDAPTLTGIKSSLPGGSEDTAYTITKAQLLAGFTDKDSGETTTLDIANLVAQDADGNNVGTFTPNNTTAPTQWSFAPAANFNGTVNLSYDVTDGITNTAATNSFNLAAVNDVPELTGTKAVLTAGTEDTTYTIYTSDLLAGYTDADTGETATLSILGLSATGGFITKVDNSEYTFTPNPDFNGTVDLNYVVTDGKGGNQLATNSFNIQAVNDKPVRTAGNVSTLFLIEDAPIASMGLNGLAYSVGGGTDERTGDNTNPHLHRYCCP